MKITKSIFSMPDIGVVTMFLVLIMKINTVHSTEILLMTDFTLEYVDFLHDAQSANINNNDLVTLITKPVLEISHSNSHSVFEFKAKPIEISEKNRTARGGFYWEELSVSLEKTHFDIKVGKIKEHWGTLETQNLVDIINTVDYLDGFLSTQKLSQDTLQLGIPIGQGKLNLYTLFGSTPRQFNSSPTQLTPYTISNHNEYLNGADPDDIDFALRYWSYYNNLDYGISAFYGTSREPYLADNSNGFIPTYSDIFHVGLDALFVSDKWVYKFEGIMQNGHGNQNNSTGFSVGAEYSFTKVFNNTDIAAISEYHYHHAQPLAPKNINNNDMMLGTQFEFNDINLSSLFVGILFDIDTPEESAFIVKSDIGISDTFRIDFFAAVIGGESRSNTNESEEGDHVRIRFNLFLKE